MDLIDRQAAIDAFDCTNELIVGGAANAQNVVNYINKVVGKIKDLPSVQRDTDEWCHDCSEYDNDRHCCPRWNKVIRETLKDAQPEVIRCKDCVNHVDDRCLAANHHTGDTEYCMEVFGAKMKGEQPC